MSASELIEILRSHPDATIYVEASWAELTNKIKVGFQPAKEYYRANDAIVIWPRDEAEVGAGE